jgi:hypothetical protein
MNTTPFRSACFFSTDNGSTVQRRASASEEQSFPLPIGVTNLFRFDETQTNNAGLSAQWASNSAPFTMAGSQVLVDGQPAAFDPPGLLFKALENSAALWSKMENTPDALTREELAQLGAISFSAKGLLV